MVCLPKALLQRVSETREEGIRGTPLLAQEEEDPLRVRREPVVGLTAASVATLVSVLVPSQR